MYDEDGQEIEITDEMHGEARQKLPIKILEQFETFLQNYYNDLTGGGQMVDQHGICKEVALFQTFLKGVKDLYWQCAGCDRTISPREKAFEVLEEWYCKACFDKGI